MDLRAYFRENCDLGISLANAMSHHAISFVEREDSEIKGYGKIAALFYSQSALLSQDHKGILNFYNLGAQTVFGYTPDEAIGMPSVNLVPEELRGVRAEKFGKVIAERIAVSVREERLAKCGKMVKINATVFPYLLDSRLSIAARVSLSS